MSKKPIGVAGGTPEGKTENVAEPQDSKIIQYPKRSADIIQVAKYRKVSPEGTAPDGEGRILTKIEEAVSGIGSRHLEVLDRMNMLVGEEGSDDLHDLRLPRAHYDSPRIQKPVDRIRKKLLDTILYGEGGMQLKNPSEVVPWIQLDGHERDDYFKQLTSLRERAVKEIIKKYTPLRKELEEIDNPDDYKKRWEGLSEKERIIAQLLQDVRQIEHDHKIFEMLFRKLDSQKKQASFWKDFERRAKGTVPQRPEPREEKGSPRRRAMEIKHGSMSGAQMIFNFKYDDGRIFLDPQGWSIQRIEGFESEFTPAERLALVNTPLNNAPLFIVKKIADKLQDTAPEWIKEMAAFAE
ncbi:MAG: hypothetical protein Q8P56_04610 [Candidatus Uhrbacteria bacterium]|nr:hypothetical protein [Candidatus Uhrbacteria bacterium]